MTRINTNVSSLVAQNTLGRSNAALEQALTRLSTGLRINTGKDDPAGLIASENLRSDITSIQKAIGNTERANQVIATADSALGQVSSLLNDIRGLVTESANSGALSDAQIAANQLQLDESLAALNRIAQTTSFQGRKLLDGSLDFTTTAGTNFNRISSLQIDQANLGATGSVAVSVAISAAATGAQVNVTNIPAATAASAASTTASFTHAIEQATGGALTYGSGTLTLVADPGGAADGAEGNQLATVNIVAFSGAAGAVYDANSNTLNVTVATADGSTDVTDIVNAINAGSDFTATVGTNPLVDQAASTPVTVSTSLTGGRAAGSAVITITSAAAGASANAKTVTITESADPTVTTTAPRATVDGSGNITVLVADDGGAATTSLAAIASAIDNLADYSASLNVTAGNGTYRASTQTTPVVANTAGGVDASGGISDDVVFQLSGATGAEVFNVLAGASITELVTQINLVSDATGVSAIASGTTLELTSTAYGSDAFVDIKIISEGAGSVPFGTFTTAVGAGSRSTGNDAVAKINGIDANADGNRLSLNTATLDLKLDVAAGFIGNIAFNITGGGALFQLGPDVVSNQQARIGITSVNTAALGGASGLLYQLASGGTADLASDLTTAAGIVEEAIDQVTTLRGRLGAFQRTLLETNKNALSDTLINLTEAESQIRDADFAAETAALTRAQILVQSGTTVLQIANQNPQNVLALLR
jgi:flagellin